MEYQLELILALSALVSGLLRFFLRPSNFSWFLAASSPVCLLVVYFALGIASGQWQSEPGLASAALGFAVIACVLGTVLGLAIASLLRFAFKPAET